MREKFEAWVTGGNKDCPSIQRDSAGEYIVMTTYLYWKAWQAAVQS